jgi:putative membrane protein
MQHDGTVPVTTSAVAELTASGSLPFDRLPATIAPDRALLTYGLLSSLVLGPAFIVGMIYQYFRYHTLRYEIDEQGITMRWGILFRREVSLTFARIQDIQLSSNLVERWLGLAKIQLQTASGSSAAEMTVEGVREFDAMRDFLYSRMRGAKGDAQSGHGSHDPAASYPAGADELTRVLQAVATELRAIRVERERQAGTREARND